MEKQGKVQISRKLVVINSVSSLLALGFNIALLIWLQQYLLSRIQTEEYSLLPVLYSIMIFTPLITVTLTSSLGRYATAAYAEGDDWRITQIASTMTPVLAAGALIVGIFGVLLSLNIDQFLTIAPEYVAEAKMMFLLLMLSLSLKLSLAPFTIGLEMTQRYVLLNLVMTGGQFFRIAIILILLTGVSVKVLWVIVATVIADTAVQITLYVMSRKAVSALRFSLNAIDFTITRQLLSFGGWSTLTAIALSIRSSADAIVLNKLGTPLGVTCYYLGALPLQYINRATSTALNPLNPVLIAMHTGGQDERLARVFIKGGRWALWFTLSISVPLMVCCAEIMTLYVGSEYHMAGAVMLMILITYPLEQSVRMLFPLAEASANIRKLSLSVLCMSLFNLGLTIILVGVYKLDAIGSALGTAISMLIFYPLILWPLAFKIAKVSWHEWIKKTLIPGTTPAVTCSLFLIVVREFIAIDSWLILFIACGAGEVVYLVTLLLWSLQPDERSQLRGLLAGFVPTKIKYVK